MSTQNLPEINNQVDFFPSQQELNTIATIARAAASSGFYSGIGQEAKILMVLLQARELGIGPMFALNAGLDNIQGNVEMKPVLMNALIRKKGHSIKVEINDETKCVLIGTRKDGDSIREEYTIEEAVKAKLATKDNWQKYPKDMLYARCMSRLGRKLFADVLGNVYADGEVKEAKEVQLDEKKLKLAECEDVTKPQDISKLSEKEPITTDYEKKSPEMPKSDRINEESLAQLMETLRKVDDECAKNALSFIEREYKTKNYFEIPQKGFEVCMNCFNRNIEMNKQKKVSNENSST